MQIRTIQHGSKEYEQMVQLRITALLQPIGVPVSYIQPEGEKTHFHIAAFEGEEMIGCYVLTPKENGLIQLRQMAVRADHQGKGIGARIVAYAEELAQREGFTTLMMHARNPVIPFYEKSGYHIAGEEFFEVGIGHHRMEKEL